MNEPRPRGMIFTFYSFKGGVGRSMTLANVAAWLSRWGQRVLIVDWDLEAPGIEKYFKPWLRGSTDRTAGIVDIVGAFKSGDELSWNTCLLHADPPKAKQIDIISAGRDDAEYVTRLRALNWEQLFSTKSLGKYLEKLRSEWATEYDVVLIDSRTGVTDVGGICTIHLPDVVVAMFTANEQSLGGVTNVLKSARAGHGKLPVDRLRLLVVPVPSRDESNSEYKLAEEWRAKFASAFSEFFEDWVPKDESPAGVLNYLKIPYFAYWSFGERVPVLEQEDPENPKTLAYAYQPLAKLILGKMNWIEAREGVKASEEAQRQAAEAERARLRAVEVTEEAKEKEAARRAEKSQQESAELQARTEEYLKTRLGEQRSYWSYVAVRYATRGRMFNAYAIGFPLLSTIFVLLAKIPNVFSAMNGGRTILITSAVLGLAAAAACYWYAGKCRAKARSAGNVASELTREETVFRASAHVYSDLAPSDAFERLVSRVEAILNQTLTSASEESPKSPVKDAPKPPSIGLSNHIDQVSTARDKLVAEPAPDDSGYAYDVFISFRPQALTKQWLESAFLPLFSFWLEEELGKRAKLYVDNAEENQFPDRTARAVMRSRSLLAFLTSSYFRSPNCLSHWKSFVLRAGAVGVEPAGLIMPVVIHGAGRDTFPSEAQNIQQMDLSDFFITGQAFQQTERYITFQQHVKELAKLVANRVQNAPSFDSNFPVVLPDDVDVEEYSKPVVPRLT